MAKNPQEEYNKSYALTRQQNQVHGSNERVGWSSDRKAPSHESMGSRGSASGCFPSGTLINTPGGVCDIATLQEGEQVVSVDPWSMTLTTARILKTHVHRDSIIWRLGFEDGTSIRTTAVHAFRVDGRWRRALAVQPGDRLTVCDPSGHFTTKTIAHAWETSERAQVYNLIVEGGFQFLADGLVVHSFSYFRTIRVWGWSLYAWVRSQFARAQPPAESVMGYEGSGGRSQGSRVR